MSCSFQNILIGRNITLFKMQLYAQPTSWKMFIEFSLGQSELRHHRFRATSVNVPLYQLKAWPGHRGLPPINPVMINQGHHQACGLLVWELAGLRNEGIWRTPLCCKSCPGWILLALCFRLAYLSVQALLSTWSKELQFYYIFQSSNCCSNSSVFFFFPEG